MFSHVFDGTYFNKSGCEGFAYKMKMEAGTALIRPDKTARIVVKIVVKTK